MLHGMASGLVEGSLRMMDDGGGWMGMEKGHLVGLHFCYVMSRRLATHVFVC